MPDVYTSLGILIGLLSIVINILQYFKDRSTRKIVAAAKGTMDAIGAACKETLNNKELISNPIAVQEFVRRIQSLALSGKKTLDAALPDKKPRLTQQGNNAIE